MTWFDDLTGFPERSADAVRAKLRLDGTRLTSLANHRSFEAGRFTTPQLARLRDGTKATAGRRIELRECVADVRSLHRDVANQHAVFQVASQFNCLEMAAADVTPEQGVGIYQYDPTQGPACSVCAGAGTIYRNYFVPVNGRIGQTHDNQIDCLSQIERFFGAGLWRMQNGYCLPSAAGLADVEQYLAACTSDERDDLRGRLQVGVQSGTQVTVDGASHLLTQVFCSALPVAYSDLPPSAWKLFPRLILEASYEATFHIAVQNFLATGCNKLYLTLVGGGVFGNRIEWILSAIDRALNLFAWAELDVSIVSYRSPQAEVSEFVSTRGAV